MKRATIYLNEDLHRALKVKAAEVESSISDLVNASVRESLAEDLDDLQAFHDRADEPTSGFEDFLNRLRATQIPSVDLHNDIVVISSNHAGPSYPQTSA